MGKRSGKAARGAAAEQASRAPRAAEKAGSARSRFPSVSRRVPDQVPDNIAVTWKPLGDGGGELYLAYEGPLAASAKALLARSGTLRSGGDPWSETRDVSLTRQGPGSFVGVIAVPAGAPVEAIEFAFHTGDAWDNGGRAPLGFYEWSAKEQRIEAR